MPDPMCRQFYARSLERARWIAELSSALTEAEQLLAQLEFGHVRCAETIRLAFHIRLLQSELDGMNRVAPAEDRVVGEPWQSIKLAAGF
jgi:hypothetical protein